MPRFFVRSTQITDGVVTVTGDDAHHISRSLRMAAGEHITVCDMQRMEYDCVLEEFLPDCVRARVISSSPSETEPPYRAVVLQALPKGDKLDSIIQKAVECGASEILPFESERCVVRIKPDAEEKKTARRARIAEEAAKQCGRSLLPTVRPSVDFKTALSEAARADLALFCYEGDGTQPLPAILRASKETLLAEGKYPTVSMMIGSEGGFSQAEAQAAIAAGMHPVGLGRRILRTETAASFALACLVYEWELLR